MTTAADTVPVSPDSQGLQTPLQSQSEAKPPVTAFDRRIRQHERELEAGWLAYND